MSDIYYSPEDFLIDAKKLSTWIKRSSGYNRLKYVYGIPRGGMPLAYTLSSLLHLPMIFQLGAVSEDSILIVDDVIDSGTTRNRFKDYLFACIHVKAGARALHGNIYYAHKDMNAWIHYFWEGQEPSSSIEDNYTRILQYVGEDVTREGLLETPKRMAKAFKEMCSGYEMKVEDVIKDFDACGCNELVLMRDIELQSLCEHHVLPFIGYAHVAYIPNGRVIGASKLARIVDIFSKRLQIQERIGEQVTDALMKHLNAKAAACIITAKHMCMQCRGIKKQSSSMVTSSLKGIFIDGTMQGIAARAELMSLINLGR